MIVAAEHDHTGRVHANRVLGDPVQGFQAYESALDLAGNPDYLVQMLEGAGHVMVEVEIGCPGEYVGTEYMTEYLDTLEFWLMDR